MKRKYDLAFSMGFGCGCSKALRAARLQYASYPMDWVGITGVIRGAEMIAADFAGWLDKPSMGLIDVRRDDEDYQRSYVNRRTGFVFTHDFPYATGFDEAFAAAELKHGRRIRRLMDGIRAAKDVLAVYVEHPVHERVPDDEIVRAHGILSKKFPGTRIDLLYFHHKDGAADCLETRIADGVRTIACECRQFDYGLVSHGIEVDGIVRYLREHATVDDPRSDEEKRAFAEKRRVASPNRFGGGLSGWIARQQYRVYRKLERRLKDKNLLPRERPFWY